MTAKRYKDKEGNEYTKDELTDVMAEIMIRILYQFPDGLEESVLRRMCENVWEEMGLPEKW